MFLLRLLRVYKDLWGVLHGAVQTVGLILSFAEGVTESVTEKDGLLQHVFRFPCGRAKGSGGCPADGDTVPNRTSCVSPENPEALIESNLGSLVAGE